MKHERYITSVAELAPEQKWRSNAILLNYAIKASKRLGLIGLVLLLGSQFLLAFIAVGSSAWLFQIINSVSADVVGGAIFAILVGNYAVRASQVDPKEAPLEERILMLFNNSLISEGAKKHLKDYVGDFSTYSPSYELILEYTQYNAEYKFYEVIVHAKRVLISSLRREITHVTLPLDIYTDNIPGWTGPKAQLINNIVKSSLQNEDTVQLPILIYETHYRHNRTYTITPAETVEIRQKYSVLHADGQSYRCVPQRYTDMLTVRFINRTSNDIRIYDLTKNVDVSVSPSHEYPFTFDEHGLEEVELFRTYGPNTPPPPEKTH